MKSVIRLHLRACEGCMKHAVNKRHSHPKRSSNHAQPRMLLAQPRRYYSRHNGRACPRCINIPQLHKGGIVGPQAGARLVHRHVPPPPTRPQPRHPGKRGWWLWAFEGAPSTLLPLPARCFPLLLPPVHLRLERFILVTRAHTHSHPVYYYSSFYMCCSVVVRYRTVGYFSCH